MIVQPIGGTLTTTLLTTSGLDRVLMVWFDMVKRVSLHNDIVQVHRTNSDTPQATEGRLTTYTGIATVPLEELKLLMTLQAAKKDNPEGRNL
jgi:hypothetical protein